MIAYTWDDKYLIGHAEIDQQHLRLFAILNELYTAMKEHHGEEGITVALDELTHYVQWHFETEERVMDEIGYPQREEHGAAHQEFTRQVAEMRRRAPYLHAFELLNFIGFWIVRHVGQADVAVGKYLRTLAAQAAATEDKTG